jgi:REP element-mobilizing transposase RayT
MKQLSDIFAIDLCAYTVLSNHYHIILHVDSETSAAWSEQEVIERWQRLFSLPDIVQRYLSIEITTKVERKVVSELATLWRNRLQDISWFMRCLNEPIARQANKEDGCTGRYWEGRFKSQALLDEKALAACMAYVDLNPVRSGIANTPEDSKYTSIVERVAQLKSPRATDKEDERSGLLPFVGNTRQNMPKGLPWRLVDYLELVDWTGRAILERKRYYIPETLPPVLERLQIDTQNWLYLTQHFESKFKGLVGACNKLKQVCQNLGYSRTPNLGASLRYLT